MTNFSETGKIKLQNIGGEEMSLKKEWVKPGLRVLTRSGPGEIISYGEICQVVLDNAVGKIAFFEKDGIVIESDFTVVRVINLGTFTERLITSAQNYPSWEECLRALEEPFAQNETLLALNFQERKFESNRPLGNLTAYQILEIYLDKYQSMETKFYDSIQEAMEAWLKITELSGASSILLCTLIDLEASQILARAIFSTFGVCTKEIW